MALKNKDLNFAVDNEYKNTVTAKNQAQKQETRQQVSRVKTTQDRLNNTTTRNRLQKEQEQKQSNRDAMQKNREQAADQRRQQQNTADAQRRQAQQMQQAGRQENERVLEARRTPIKTREGYTVDLSGSARVKEDKSQRLTFDRGTTPEERREQADMAAVAMREDVNSRQKPAKEGSDLWKWQKMPLEDQALAVRMMEDDDLEADDPAVQALAKKYGNGDVGTGVDALYRLYAANKETAGEKAYDQYMAQYEQDEKNREDLQTAARDRGNLKQFTDDEILLLKGHYGFADPVDMNDVYFRMGLTTLKAQNEFENKLVERAGGSEAAKQLVRTAYMDQSEAAAKQAYQAGKALPGQLGGGFWGGAGATAAAAGATVADTVGGAGKAVGRFMLGHGDYNHFDQNFGGTANQFAAGVHQQVSENIDEATKDSMIGNLLATHGYNAGVNLIDNTIRNLMFNKAGLYLMGLNAFNQSMDEAANTNMDPSAAIVVSLFKAAGEVGTEKMPTEQALKMLGGNGSFMDWLKGAAADIIGEEASNAIGNTAEAVVYGENSTKNQKIREIVLGSNGVITPEEATAQVDREVLQEYIDTFIETAMTNVAQGGSDALIGKARRNRSQNNQATETQQEAPLTPLEQAAQALNTHPGQQEETPTNQFSPAFQAATDATFGVTQEAAPAAENDVRNYTVSDALEEARNGQAPNVQNETGNRVLDNAVTKVANGETVSNKQAEALLDDPGAMTAIQDATGEIMPDGLSKSQKRGWIRAQLEAMADISYSEETAQEPAAPAVARNAWLDSKAADGWQGDDITQAQATTMLHNPEIKGALEAVYGPVNTVADVRRAFEAYMDAVAGETNPGVTFMDDDDGDPKRIRKPKPAKQKAAETITDAKAGDNIEGSDIELKKDFQDYPYNQQEVIEGYEDSVDEDIMEFIDKNENGQIKSGDRIQVGTVSDRMAEDVEKKTGVSGKSGSKIYFTKDALDHVKKRHGAKGKRDHTMANPQDIARVNFVLQNYDDCGNVRETTTFLNKDGTPAKSLEFWKKINGTYFVVEAVPDGAKTWVVSTFMDENRSEQTPDARNNSESPKGHVQNASANAPTNNIGVNAETVKSKNAENPLAAATAATVSNIRQQKAEQKARMEAAANLNNQKTDNGTSVGAASSGFTNDAEYNQLGQKYGVQPPRASDAVPTNVPKQDGNGGIVSEHASNLYGSPITKDNVLPELRKLIVDGIFSHQRQTNKQNAETALQEMTGKTMGEVLEGLETLGQQGLSGPVPVAKSQLLYEYVMNQMDQDKPMTADEKRLFARVISAKNLLSVNAGRGLQQFADERRIHPEVAKLVFQMDAENSYKLVSKQDGYLDEQQRQEIADLKQQRKDARTLKEKMEIDREIKAVKNRGAEIQVPAEMADAIQVAYEQLANAKNEVQKNNAKAEIGRLYDALGDVAAAQLKATMKTKIKAWRYLCMLGNPVTQIRNFAGNGLTAPYAYFSHQLGAILNQAFQSEETRAKDQNSTAFVNLLSEGDRELVQFGKDDLKNNQDVSNYLKYSAKFTDTAAKQRITAKLKTFDTRFLEGWRTITNKAAKGGDVFYKNRYYPQELASWLKGHGITSEMIANGEVSTEVLNQGRAYALNQADRMTFNDENKFSEWASSVGRKIDNKGNAFSWLTYMVLEGRAPFRATPANIGVRAVEASPLGIGKGLGEILWAKMNGAHEGKYTVSKGLNDVAEGLTGTAIMGMGYLLAQGFMGFKLHGNEVPPEDEKDGVQKFSLEFSINGQRYTEKLSNLGGPNLYAMVAGATIFERIENAGGHLEAADFFDIAKDTLDPLFETSMLSGIAEVIQSAKYSDDVAGEIWDVFASSTMSMLTQCIPTAAKQVVGAVFDNKRRSYYNGQSKMLKPFGQSLASIPGIGDALGLRMDRLDEYGDEIPSTVGPNNLGTRLLSTLNPGTLTRIQDDPLRAELKRLNDLDLGDTELILKAGTSGSGGLVKKGTDMDENGDFVKNSPYTKEEWAEMAKVEGEVNKQTRDFIQSKEYKAMSDQEKYDALKDRISRANTTAKQSHLWEAVQGFVGKSRKNALGNLEAKNGDYAKMATAIEKNVSFQDFRKVANNTSGKTKSTEKMYGVLDSGATSRAVDAMLPSYMSDSQREKWETVKGTGLSSRDFVKAYDACQDANGKKGSTGLSQDAEERLIAYFRKQTYTNSGGKQSKYSESAALKMIHLMQAGYTEEQAKALYQIMNMK